MMQKLVDAQQSHLSAPLSSLYNRLPEKDRGTKVLEVGARAVFFASVPPVVNELERVKSRQVC